MWKKPIDKKENTIPLGRWILLFLTAIVLPLLSYELLIEFISEPFLYVIASMALLALYALDVKLLEKKSPSDLHFKRLLPDLGLGLLIGYLFFCLVAGIMVALGLCRIVPNNFSWSSHFKPILFCLFISVGEEMVFRGILFRWIDNRWGTMVALIVSSLLFGAMHLINIVDNLWGAIAIALEAGLLLGSAYKYSGTLWLPIGIHWSWNLALVNVFDFSASENAASNAFFKVITNGPEFLTGGNLGAEGSVISVVIGLLLSIGFLHRHYKKNRTFAP